MPFKLGVWAWNLNLLESQNGDFLQEILQELCQDYVGILILFIGVNYYCGLPQQFSGKESTCQCSRHRFNSWVWKTLWRKKWLPSTHSSILAWEISWTEEPDGLQSMGSKRVGHELVTKQQQNHYCRHLSNIAYIICLGLDINCC